MDLYVVAFEYILAEAGRARSILSVWEPRISFSAFFWIQEWTFPGLNFENQFLPFVKIRWALTCLSDTSCPVGGCPVLIPRPALAPTAEDGMKSTYGIWFFDGSFKCEFFCLWRGLDSWPQGETFPVSCCLTFRGEKKAAPPSSLGSAFLLHSWMGPLTSQDPGDPRALLQCSFPSTWQPRLIERFPGIFMWKPKKILQGRF